MPLTRAPRSAWHALRSGVLRAAIVTILPATYLVSHEAVWAIAHN